MPIEMPSQVSVQVVDGLVTVKGPKGELQRQLNPEMAIVMKDGYLNVSRPADTKQYRALHGLTRTLLANMVEGVTKGYEKGLEVSGVGYRVEKDGENLIFRVGFSHPVVIKPRPGISFDVDAKNVGVKVIGINKELVGQTAAEIRYIRPPDAYKGKGIRYAGEYIKLKPGKAGKAVGGGKSK